MRCQSAANLALEILRFQVRLAKDLQCLKVESYGFAAKQGPRIKICGGAPARSSVTESRRLFLAPRTA